MKFSLNSLGNSSGFVNLFLSFSKESSKALAIHIGPMFSSLRMNEGISPSDWFINSIISFTSSSLKLEASFPK